VRRSDQSELLCGIDPDCTQCSSCYQSPSPEDREIRERANEGVLVGEIVRRVMERLGQSPVSVDSSSAREPEALDRCPVGVSVRHMHVTREHLDLLFGPEYQLNPFRPLYQPGDFASQASVTLIGANLRTIQNVRILGPERKYTQVELSRTDSIYLGLKPPIRPSGNLEGAERITIAGPRGSITVNSAILANRHIHISPESAARLGLSDGQEVLVETPGESSIILKNVFMKFGKGLKLELHLDTDIANAAGLKNGDFVRILK